MKPSLFALAGAFGALVVQKAVVEPVARRVGVKAIERYIGPACERLDLALDLFGLDIDPEEVIRDYLDLTPAELTEEQINRIAREVLKRWDLKVYTKKRSER